MLSSVCCVFYVTQLLTFHRLKKSLPDRWTLAIHDELVATLEELPLDRTFLQRNSSNTYHHTDGSKRITIIKYYGYYSCIVSYTEFLSYDVMTSIETRKIDAWHYKIPSSLLHGPATVVRTGGTFTVSPEEVGSIEEQEQTIHEKGSPKEQANIQQLWELFALAKEAARKAR